eukprot:626045-Pelagomonas_calceolata.AAC.1
MRGAHSQRVCLRLKVFRGTSSSGTSALACAPLLPHPYYVCVPSAMTGHEHFPLPAVASLFMLQLSCPRRQ